MKVLHTILSITRLRFFLAYLPYQLLRLGMPALERSGSRVQFIGLFSAWIGALVANPVDNSGHGQ